MVLALLLLVACLAFANGANDNSKGVATLVGYGAATPRQALTFAAITTALGAAASFWLAGGLIKTFSTGLFAADAVATPALFVAVLVGACGWIAFATLTGLPVSTTHAITGGLCGAGVVAFGAARVEWPLLGSKFAVPLAVSPALSLALVYALATPVAFAVRRAAGRCVCVAPTTADGATARLAVVSDDVAACADAGAIARVGGTSAANALHWTGGGLVGFARGWNDAPKIAALAVVAVPAHVGGAFALVTIAMAAGGLLAGRRVLTTLSTKVTTLPLAESLTASLTSAALVGLASWRGLPVSTTHVITGGIVGAGLAGDPRGVRWRKVGEIAISWVVTLPVAAILAAIAARALL